MRKYKNRDCPKKQTSNALKDNKNRKNREKRLIYQEDNATQWDQSFKTKQNC